MVGEDLLHAALAVIEVALYSAYRYIFAFLCHHLAFLHIAYALDRIEYHDLRAGNVLESFQRSLTGITGSSSQDHDLILDIQLFYSCGQEIRQDLECHVLECTGRAMPQFQHISSLEQVCDLCNVLGVKCLCCVCTFCAVAQLSIGIISQILGKYERSTLCIVHTCQRFQFVHGDRRNRFRHKQAAFFRNSLCNCRSAFYTNAAVSGAFVKHCYHPFPGRYSA